MDGHRELIQQLLSEGHEIGNHSHGHFAFPTREDVAACSALIQHLSGAATEAIPPPLRRRRPPRGRGRDRGRDAGDPLERRLRRTESLLGRGSAPRRSPATCSTTSSRARSCCCTTACPGAEPPTPCRSCSRACSGEGYRFVTVSELLADSDLRRPSPSRRVLRRLRRRLGTNAGNCRRSVAPRCPIHRMGNGSAPHGTDGDRDRKHLVELLETVAEGVEAPEAGNLDPRQADPRGMPRPRRSANGFRSARAPRPPRCEVNSRPRDGARLLVEALREQPRASAAPLPERFAVRLRDADDPGRRGGADRTGAGGTDEGEAPGRSSSWRRTRPRRRASGPSHESPRRPASRPSRASSMPRRSSSRSSDPDPRHGSSSKSWARETCRAGCGATDAGTPRRRRCRRRLRHRAAGRAGSMSSTTFASATPWPRARRSSARAGS